MCIFNDLFCFVGALYLLTLLCVRIFQNKRVYLGHKNMKDDLIVLQTLFISRFYKDNHYQQALNGSLSWDPIHLNIAI